MLDDLGNTILTFSAQYIASDNAVYIGLTGSIDMMPYYIFFDLPTVRFAVKTPTTFDDDATYLLNPMIKVGSSYRSVCSPACCAGVVYASLLCPLAPLVSTRTSC
eukprot:6503607-Pyramimonas_sp.AAC.1